MDNYSNYTSHKQLGFDALTKEQCEALHCGMLQVLRETGVEVHTQEAIDIYKKGGAFVDGNRVRFPEYMVERALKSAPSEFTVYSRDFESKMLVGARRTYYGPGATPVNIIDPYTGERRPPKYKDICNAIRLIDSLPNLDYNMDFGTTCDVEDSLIDVYNFKALIENTTKPIIHWSYGRDNTKAIVEMAAKVRGSLEELQKYPLFIMYSEPVSPLLHEYGATDVAVAISEYGLPLIHTGAAQAGMTSPVTLAGTLVVQLCECISGLVLNQLIREGNPFVMGGSIYSVDMKSMQPVYGGAELCILSAALCSMSEYYNIPVFTNGGSSDSKCSDAQSGIDQTLNLLTSALAGSNIIHNIGYLEAAITGSFENIVIGDDIVGEVKRIIRSLTINEDTLAVDLINKVGPGGSFIAEEHTFQNFAKEAYVPSLISRDVYAKWKAAGSKNLTERANEVVRDRIENYQPVPLTKEISEECDKIIDAMLKK